MNTRSTVTPGADQEPFVLTRVSPDLDADRERAADVLRDVLAPDAARVQDVLQRDHATLRREAAELGNAASPDRDAAAAALEASSVALRERLATLATAGGLVRRFLLDIADDIAATSRIEIIASHRGPTPDDNWVRFAYDVEDHSSSFRVGGDSVTFDFHWRNDGQAPVVVDVDGYLVLDGTGVALCDGGIVAFTSANLRFEPVMHLRELWNSPATEPPVQDAQHAVALDVSCEATGIFETGGIAGQNVFRGFALQHTGEVVPAGGTLQIGLTLDVRFAIVGGGEVQAAFATGTRRLTSPGVLITVNDL